MNARTRGVILTLITIAGAALRLSHLTSRSLWLDEGATVTLARASWSHFAWVWWHGEANLQTLYFLLMRGWIHLGLSEAWLRLPSALFGIASIPLMYVVARRFTGESGALGAAALLAFSPTHVYFSQEARSYTLAMLLVLLATYFFLSAVESGRTRDWALWTTCGILAFYTHDFTALVLGAQALSLAFMPPPRPWRRVIVGGAIIFVAALPGLTYVFRASPENLHFAWMPRPSLREFWRLLMFFGGNGVKLALAIVLWVAGVCAVRQRSWRGAFILCWAIVPAVLLALISLRQPLFLQRYLVFSLPAMILLAALGVGCLRRWCVGPVLVVALCAMSLPTIEKEYRKPVEDWRGAVNAVLTSASPGDAVVFFPFYTRIMLDYYRDRYGSSAPPVHVFAPAYYSSGEDARDLLATLEREPHQFRRVWVVETERPHGSPNSEHPSANPGAATVVNNLEFGPPLAGRLEELFGHPTVREFAGVTLLEYGGS
jgi:4-amino-4-deoxy-L-arabinose transferase-like glycosyltransferase